MGDKKEAGFIRLNKDHHGIGKTGKQMRAGDVVQCETAAMPQPSAYYIKHGLGHAADTEAFKKTLAADNKANLEAEQAAKDKAAKEKAEEEEAAKKAAGSGKK